MKQRTFKGKTPNALPPTMIQLGEIFGGSLTLVGAKRISHINVAGYTDSKTRKPNYWVDIYMFDEKGGDKINRSSRTKLTRRQARDVQRLVTRKIALFLFENQSHRSAA